MSSTSTLGFEITQRALAACHLLPNELTTGSMVVGLCQLYCILNIYTIYKCILNKVVRFAPFS